MEYLHTLADGSTIKYTEEMIKNVIADASYFKTTANEARSKNFDIRSKVYDFFKDRYDSGDDEITCTVTDVNDLLESIGLDKLRALFTVNGTISFSVVDVEADSEEDARDIVTNSLELQFTDEGSLDGWDVEVTDASQQ